MFVQSVQKYALDPDYHVGLWLQEGAPLGIARCIPCGGLFPTSSADAQLTVEELLSAHHYSGNHPSFSDTHGEAEAPPLALLREFVGKGFGDVFEDKRAADEMFGTTFPAPLGNIRKRKQDGTFKNRVIQDLKANSVNLASSVPERLVLPRGIDHAKDVADLAAGEGINTEVGTMVLDFEDAFMSVPLHEEERRFNCADLGASPNHDQPRFVVWRVLGFGGKPNPLVFGRVASFAARSGQALLDDRYCRLQIYVDDPVLSVAGERQECLTEIDILSCWWLTLGIPLAWKKGCLSFGSHTWVGIVFCINGSTSVMRLTDEFTSEFLSQLDKFCQNRGVASLKAARSVVGKAARVAQVVPEASAFAASLWAALTESLRAARVKPEAPLGRVAIRRFASPALWFRALLS